jgi:hypothetical protein
VRVHRCIFLLQYIYNVLGRIWDRVIAYMVRVIEFFKLSPACQQVSLLPRQLPATNITVELYEQTTLTAHETILRDFVLLGSWLSFACLVFTTNISR